MKKLLTLSVLFAFLILSPKVVLAKFTKVDQQIIDSKIQLLKNAVNSSNTLIIEKMLSPNASESLKQDIEANIKGQNINYRQSINNYQEISPDKVKINGKFSAKGVSWEVNNLPNYFIFEKANGDWYLIESDFAKKLSPNYVLKVVGKIFLFLSPVLLLISAFWIWMLVDIAKKPIENKAMWIVIVLFTNWIGALIYFFTIRKRFVKTKLKEASS